MTEPSTGLAVYIGKELTGVASTDSHITKAQLDLLCRKTPAKYIKKRKGRGGKELSYVEISYVQGVLNAVFGLDWDIKVVEKIIDFERHSIALLVELIVRFADGHIITKHAWGGSDIKRTQDGEGLVDFADDLKAAQSDGIKKAASMLGVAWDVFGGLSEWQETVPAYQGLSKFHLLKELGDAKIKVPEYYDILHKAGFNHANEIPPERRQDFLDTLRAVYLAKAKEKKIEQEKKV